MRNKLIIREATIEDTISWYVIHTHLKQEDRACSNLKVLGVPTFNPKIRERCNNRFVNALTYVTKPLFPRYIFAQFDINDLYHKVRFTRGIYSVVSFGEVPTSIDEKIITMIQANIKEDGFVRFVEEIRTGDRVIVKDGPLKNFAGLFEREMKDTDRVRILLETVSYQAHIEIERDLVKKAG
jgi:transcriptional antiterminator RfaH